MATGSKRRMSLSTQVLAGLVLGLLAGVGFGEHMAPLQDVGKAFILLLQMPVLPYITLSLITGLGRLNYQQVKMLALNLPMAQARGFRVPPCGGMRGAFRPRRGAWSWHIAVMG
jgi:L-cystine uptake protein TcyP (sodium:dicarboxylate symporter family)